MFSGAVVKYTAFPSKISILDWKYTGWITSQELGIKTK